MAASAVQATGRDQVQPVAPVPSAAVEEPVLPTARATATRSVQALPMRSATEQPAAQVALVLVQTAHLVQALRTAPVLGMVQALAMAQQQPARSGQAAAVAQAARLVRQAPQMVQAMLVRIQVSARDLRRPSARAGAD